MNSYRYIPILQWYSLTQRPRQAFQVLSTDLEIRYTVSDAPLNM